MRVMWGVQGRLAASAAGAAAMVCALALPASAHDGHDHGGSAPVVSGSCYVMKSAATGRYIARERGDAYAANAPRAADAEPFRVQVTGLDRYLLIDTREQVLSPGPLGGLTADSDGSGRGDWALEKQDDGTLTLGQPQTKSTAAVAPRSGQVHMAATADDQVVTHFAAEDGRGCAKTPEVSLSASGKTATGDTPFGEVSGFLDTHLHGMAFEFLGGKVHCGRPWHPEGAAAALTDCPDHYLANGTGAILENFFSQGLPVGSHDPVGWPTFRDWPSHASLTHEQTYYRWIERTWRGGLRIMVNLFVENEVLCDVYPLKKNPCDDMNSIRLQAKDIYAMQDFIDAQHGGPGKGWYRIVTDPFQARRVINEGKLAVVLGIETSSPFGCNVINDVPQCSAEDVDKGLDEVYDIGVRDMELINKFDNAFGGVRFDSGPAGAAINAANRLKTGQFWQAKTCTGKQHDNPLTPGFPDSGDQLLGAGLLVSNLPVGLVPAYPPPPHCNVRGLTQLGEHMVDGMIDRGMIIDPDHLSVLARSHALNIVEKRKYSGVVSSHSWGDPEADARILRAGGVIGPRAYSSKFYVNEWKRIRKLRDPRYEFGLGFGPDTGGFGKQSPPRGADVKNPVKYPFTSYDGNVTFKRQTSGERVFDINTDGVAHYGMYPDWIEDIRMLEGKAPVRDMANGAEAYLQMWERANGVPYGECIDGRGKLRGGGVGPVSLGQRVEPLLMTAGQPEARDGRGFRWCATGKGELFAELTGGGAVELALSSATGHRLKGIAPGDHEPGSGMRTAGRSGDGRVVYRVKGGRVTHIGVATKKLAKKGGRLEKAAKQALKA